MSEDDSVKHEGKWTRDDLPGVHWPGIHGESERQGAEKALDAVVAHLNEHYLPKPGIDNGPTAIESTLARERDEAIGRASSAEYELHKERKRAEKAERPPYDQGGVRGADGLLYRAERAERERDAAAARAEKAEQLIPAYAMLDIWGALGRDSIHFDDWYDEHGYADAWAELAAAVREAAEARTAPAVSRADVEEAIRCEFLDWEGQLEARISRAVNQTWNLVSGADPAVHVVRESQIHAITDPEDARDFNLADGQWEFRDPTESDLDHAWDEIESDLRYLISVRRAIEAEQADDPVEAKARELYRVATPDARWETVADEYRRIAAHVLGLEAAQ